MQKLPQFNKHSFFMGAGIGSVLGTFTGTVGAAITGSNHIAKTAAILGSGLGLFLGGANFSGFVKGSRERPPFKRLSFELAVMEFLGGSTGYLAYRMLVNTAASTLPMKEFATNVLGGYPITLGAFLCIYILEDYFNKKNRNANSHTPNIPPTPDTPRPKLT